MLVSLSALSSGRGAEADLVAGGFVGVDRGGEGAVGGERGGGDEEEGGERALS